MVSFSRLSLQLLALHSFSNLFLQVNGFSVSPLTQPSKHKSKLVLQSDKAGLVLNSDLSDSILSSAFSSLKEEDKYDTVLTGLCAKILDGKEGPDAMQGPTDLLNEMNTRRIKASQRSLSALVDVGAKSNSPVVMSDILTLCVRNSGISYYGSEQNAIKLLPARGFSDSSRNELPFVPADDRLGEITSAISVSLLTIACLVLSNNVGSGPTLTDSLDLGLPAFTSAAASFVLYALGTVALVDNAYDALKGVGKGLNLLAQGKIKLPELPDKDKMPLGLGTGQVSGTVTAGLTRLLSVDTERDCQCEAASFFVAYSLGLPCFAFRPNSLEAVVMIFESIRGNESDAKISNIDPLLSSPGILKILIWLMAPVAAESMKHPQLISSDPREAAGLLKRLEKTCADRDIDLYSIMPLIEDDQELVLRWAYQEAESMLLRNRKVCDELVERLAGGAATVGDCVAVMEGW